MWAKEALKWKSTNRAQWVTPLKEGLQEQLLYSHILSTETRTTLDGTALQRWAENCDSAII